MQSAQPLVVESLGIVSLPVSDQTAAIEWYEDVLGFEVVTDEPFEMHGETGRWVTIAPANAPQPEIALVTADEELYDDEMNDRIESRIGTDQMWTFTTSDIDAAVAHLKDTDVDVDDIRKMPWGRFAMFRDLDGNELQLFEAPAPTN